MGANTPLRVFDMAAGWRSRAVMLFLVHLTGGVMVFTLLLGAASIAAARTVPQYDTQWWQELDVAGSAGDRSSYLVSGMSA